MKYKNLGNSGLKVSEIGLGTYINFGEKISENEAIKIVHKAYDSGINFFDTADAYAGGKAEEILGKSLKDFKRDSVVVASKCFMPRNESINARGLSRKNIRHSVDESLKNSKLEYIDLLYCHRFDPECPLEETISALHDLIQAGKILYWGISRWETNQIKDALDLCKQLNKYKPIANQYVYNLLNAEGEDQFEFSKRNGIGVVSYSALAQGVLTEKYLGDKIPKDSRAANESLKERMWNFNEKDFARAQEFNDFASKQNLKLNHLAIAWCLANSSVNSVLVGASSVTQLEDNLKALDLSREQSLSVKQVS